MQEEEVAAGQIVSGDDLRAIMEWIWTWRRIDLLWFFLSCVVDFDSGVSLTKRKEGVYIA
jgi:hypothetical protein